MAEPVKIDLSKVVPMQQGLAVFDRMSGVLNIYHQHAKTQPMGANIRWARQLEHVAQPLRRTAIANMPWELPDLHWLGAAVVGNVLIENHGRNPKEVLWLSHNGRETHEIVLPGLPYFGCPVDIERFWYSSPTGPLEITITIFPR
jgi:hypothetical protein